jgi:glycosyltransferase involved in cell wall biosynthesis
LQLAYIGSLSWLKGLHVALEAISGMEGALELWVAGDPLTDPAYADRLRQIAGDNVHFLGRLDRAEVWQLLEKVDMLLAPSLSYETYCYSVHEALAAGVPVVASRLGALAEAVQDGVNGLLAQPGDVPSWRAAIRRLVEEPGLVARLASSAAIPSTVEAHIAQLEQVYRAAIEGFTPEGTEGTEAQIEASRSRT